ncbi:glycosyl transferase [Polymorphobacter glacialis]|uniref:Glycosyl transferase n=1 Tax=Sandarakinorhabdus glacialis TaxID=1614636 RepID=A0A916ZUF8_9SPHN|nr:glycosyltransferase family 4 protein [Polymorphobacter glacialis]GGE14465.1 glycosyl transferase [Polymorphobacter glacialis]
MATRAEQVTHAAPVAGDRPLTILFPFVGGLVGGSHISAAMLIESLDRAEFRPLVLIHGDGGAVAEMLTGRGLAFEAGPPALFPMGGNLLMSLPERVRFLKARGVDIVHTNEGRMHVAWGLAARAAGVPMLWHHRGNPGARGLRYLAPWVADRVVSVSRFAAPPAGLVSAAARTTVIHSPFEWRRGQDYSAAAAAARRELGVPADTIVLGFFGHFAARKRPLVFIETVAALRLAMPGRRFVGLMFGAELDSGLEARMRSAIDRLDLGDCVRLMGFRRPIEPWIAACDVNVVTAVDEPFGRTLIEAMLIGTPVVAAASGGNIEAIRDGETGILVERDSPAAFARGIAALLEPGRAAAMARIAADEARKRFSVDAHAEAVECLYRDLVAA